jgi:hypothetical protein
MDDLDREIFDAGEATPTPSPEPQVDESTAVRDAIKGMQRQGGRPTTSSPVPPPPPQPSPSPGPAHGVEDQSPAGLLKAMLDEREKRQGLERQLTRYQEWEQQARRYQAESEAPFDQRFFAQPQQELESFVSQKLSPIEQRVQNFMTDVDMRLARQVHGEVFDEAFQTWFQQVGDPTRPDPQTYFSVMNAGSPGEALMKWFEDHRTRSEIGEGGLQAYRDRLRNEILAEYGLAPPVAVSAPSDDTPRAPNGQFTPRHEVRLPTSLSRMGAAGRGTPAPAEDGSEEAIFDAGRPPRKR